MRKLEKILTLALAAVLVLSLAACGAKQKAEPGDETMNESGTTEPAGSGTENTTGDGPLYTYEKPDVDTVNSPSYVYYAQTIRTTDSAFLAALATDNADPDYPETVNAAIKAIPAFANTEPKQESLAAPDDGVTVEVSGEEPEDEPQTVEQPSDETGDYIIYAQDTDLKHEVDVAIYPSDAYDYVTYGTMQDVTDIENTDELDLEAVPGLIREAAGIEINRADIDVMLEKLREMRTELPDEAVYVISIVDPQTYNSVQVTMLPYEDHQRVAVTASRYVEMPTEPQP